MWWIEAAPSSANVKIVTADNATFQESYQFDDEDNTDWSFVGKTFRMDIKANHDAASYLLSFTSGASEIVVDDTALRILHFNVAETQFDPDVIPPGEYSYDLIMTDGSGVRTPLMHGVFVLTNGITGG